MKAVLFFKESDESFITEHLEAFRNYTDAELIDAYNREARLGIVGVRAQTLYLYCLRIVMRERFKTSPVFQTRENILGMQGEVRLVDGKIWFK